jgi:hypothetical protein
MARLRVFWAELAPAQRSMLVTSSSTLKYGVFRFFFPRYAEYLAGRDSEVHSAITSSATTSKDSHIRPAKEVGIRLGLATRLWSPGESNHCVAYINRAL